MAKEPACCEQTGSGVDKLSVSEPLGMSELIVSHSATYNLGKIAEILLQISQRLQLSCPAQRGYLFYSALPICPKTPHREHPLIRRGG